MQGWQLGCWTSSLLLSLTAMLFAVDFRLLSSGGFLVCFSCRQSPPSNLPRELGIIQQMTAMFSSFQEELVSLILFAATMGAGTVYLWKVVNRRQATVSPWEKMIKLGDVGYYAVLSGLLGLYFLSLFLFLFSSFWTFMTVGARLMK